MHRFFVSPEVVATSSVTLTGDQAHQIRRVLRLQPGAEVALLDGSGWVYRCAVASVNTADVRLDVLDRTQGQGEPSVYIVLHQAVLKGDHFNWVLQKGVEVGVSAFVPTVCARSVVDDMQAIDARRGRWERIIREAAEQCGRPRLPELRPAQLLSQSLEAGEHVPEYPLPSRSSPDGEQSFPGPKNRHRFGRVAEMPHQRFHNGNADPLV